MSIVIMESILTPHENVLCRTCLSSINCSVYLRPLSTIVSEKRTLYDLLLYVTDKDCAISEGNFPNHICSECESMLYLCDNFKRRCIESEETLQSWASTKEKKCVLDIKNETTKPDHVEINLIKYNCSFCPIKFTNILDLMDHTYKVHGIKTKNCYSDTSCPTVTTDNELDDCNTDDIKKELLCKISDDGTAHDDAFNDDSNISVGDRRSSTNSDICKNNVHYFCEKCNASFNKYNMYQKHLKVHTENSDTDIIVKRKRVIKTSNNVDDTLNIKCSQCHTTLKSMKALKIHVTRKHKLENSADAKKEYEICEDIGDVALNVKNTATVDDGPPEIHQCSMCMRTFTKKKSFLKHQKRHKEKANEIHNCKICKRDFQHQAHLYNHIQSVHKDNKLMDKLKDLEAVKAKTKILRKHSCVVCNKSFQMMSTLKDHMLVHSQEKPYLCSTCGRGFKQRSNLAEHMRRHQGLKPFKCETCDRGFVSKGELMAHNRKHTGAHPFVCDTCNSGFTTSSSLVKHRRTHTGEKPYECDFCTMRFAASSSLKNHRRIHTGEKPHHCAHCDKSFVQRSDLVAHMRCHTGERPYVCSVCGQAFRQNSALKTHHKIHSVKDDPALVSMPSKRDLPALIQINHV